MEQDREIDTYMTHYRNNKEETTAALAALGFSLPEGWYFAGWSEPEIDPVDHMVGVGVLLEKEDGSLSMLKGFRFGGDWGQVPADSPERGAIDLLIKVSRGYSVR